MTTKARIEDPGFILIEGVCAVGACTENQKRSTQSYVDLEHIKILNRGFIAPNEGFYYSNNH